MKYLFREEATGALNNEVGCFIYIFLISPNSDGIFIFFFSITLKKFAFFFLFLIQKE